ncbi:MAG TPA: GNAT family N-acetyltransferase [Pyrinomonadaceae bacterium]
MSQNLGNKEQSTKYQVLSTEQTPKNKVFLDGVIENMPIVRLANASDAEALASIMLLAFAEYRQQYTTDGFAATAITSEEVLSRMRQGPVFVAVIDDEIVGTASVVKKDDYLYVRGMAVLPERRGNRIGELLLTQIEEYAAREGCKRLFLSTTPFLDRAIRLYEKFGFNRTEEGPHDLFGTPLFTMEKSIHRLHRSKA